MSKNLKKLSIDTGVLAWYISKAFVAGRGVLVARKRQKKAVDTKREVCYNNSPAQVWQTGYLVN